MTNEYEYEYEYEYETIPSEPFGEFDAMAQGGVDYIVRVICTETPKNGKMLTILASEEAIYITREQAMKFFGFVEPAHD